MFSYLNNWNIFKETLEAYADHLEQLEEKIRAAQQRALDQV
jgi:hypothetical protein